jgi:hypothetical protein
VSKAPKKLTRSPLDRMFFCIVTLGWHDERVARYAEHVQRYRSMLPNDVTEAFGLIDVKATGTLTHVSLMIAGLGLIAPLVADNDLEMGVVIAEIAVYLLIAIGCLRCLAVFNSRDLSIGGAGLVAIARNELIIRRELYALCNRAAIVFTLVVFALLPVLFLYKPERHL